MAMFFDALGKKKSAPIRLAAMDMWKPFRNATRAPQAAILFDKFHVMAHLGKALDTVRKSEYVRLSGGKRGFIKGQRYTLLPRRSIPGADPAPPATSRRRRWSCCHHRSGLQSRAVQGAQIRAALMKYPEYNLASAFLLHRLASTPISTRFS